MNLLINQILNAYKYFRREFNDELMAFADMNRKSQMKATLASKMDESDGPEHA